MSEKAHGEDTAEQSLGAAAHPRGFRVFLVWSIAAITLGAVCMLSNALTGLAEVVGEWPLSGFYDELDELLLLGAALGFFLIMPCWLILPRWVNPCLLPVLFVGLAVRPKEEWEIGWALAALFVAVAVAVGLRNAGPRPAAVAFLACFALTLSGVLASAAKIRTGISDIRELGPYYGDEETDRAVAAAKPAFPEEQMPDIWWIVADHHPSPSAMDAFGYDWGQHGMMSGDELAEHYRSEGFVIDAYAVTDLPSTIATFAKVLSLTNAKIPGAGNEQRYVDLNEARLLRTLHRLGYRSHAEVGFARFIETLPFHRVSRTTDVVWPGTGSLPAIGLHGTVPVRARWSQDLTDRISVAPVGGPLEPGGWRERRCKSLVGQFDRLSDLRREADAPLFVLWHVYVPHGPLWFDKDGECYPHLPIEEKTSKHAGDAIMWLARRIPELRRSAEALAGERPALMLVQSDEGLEESLLGAEEDTGDRASKRLILSMSWTNMDTPPWSGEPPASVQAWRAIFNSITDQDLPLKPTRSAAASGSDG